jgi:hypothetical protein
MVQSLKKLEEDEKASRHPYNMWHKWRPRHHLGACVLAVLLGLLSFFMFKRKDLKQKIHQEQNSKGYGLKATS